MKPPLRQLERVASGTHYAQELLRLPLDTAVGLGAERRSGGDQRLHSPTAWLPPGHEPGADGGVATTAQQQQGVAPRA